MEKNIHIISLFLCLFLLLSLLVSASKPDDIAVAKFDGAICHFSLDKYIIFKMILLTYYDDSPFVLKPESLDKELKNIFPLKKIRKFITDNKVSMSNLNEFEIRYFLQSPFGEEISSLPADVYAKFCASYGKELDKFWNYMKSNLLNDLERSQSIISSIYGLMNLSGNIAVHLSFNIQDIRQGTKNNMSSMYWGTTNLLNSTYIELPYCEPDAFLDLLIHELTHIYQQQDVVEKRLKDLASDDSNCTFLLSDFTKKFNKELGNYPDDFTYFFQYYDNRVFLSFNETMGEINGYYYLDTLIVPLLGTYYKNYIASTGYFFYDMIGEFRRKNNIDLLITNAIGSKQDKLVTWFAIMKLYLKYLIEKASP